MSCLQKTEDFIKDAIRVHGDTYNYSKVEYTNNTTNIIIICKEHGEFPQTPKTHKKGSGCKYCGKLVSSKKRKNSVDYVIERFKIVHGDIYDYSKMVYLDVHTNIIIICKEHGDFLQTPKNHYTGQNCPKCSGLYKRTQNDFINDAKIIHNEKYDYSLVEYTRMHNKVIIICKMHGIFNQTPHGHLSGAGCKKCATEIEHNKQRSNTEEFIDKAKIIHENKYDYSNTKYIDVKTQITITCKEHGDFEQRPYNHLSSAGCPKCSGVYRRTQIDFINDAKRIHEEKYDYSKSIFINVDTKLIITCKTHGDFIKTPYHHINRRQGCQKCSMYKKYSKSAISYLDFMSKMYYITIQHADNDIEYKIPTTRYNADGYCEETNTIYEFHGTIYHGDPRCCDPLENNYFGKNYGELYQKTLEREQYIRDLGYNLVVMWEHDWNNINKSIRILQRKFRSHSL